MAIVIQQTANAINILDDALAAGDQILMAFNPNDGFPQISGDKIRITNSSKTQNFTTEIASVWVQEHGQAAALWVGTNDALIELLSTFFFINSAPADIVFVDSAVKLPAPVAGVITLEDFKTYFFTTDVDLLGDRIVCGENNVIQGTSSENSSITSTGLGVGVPLITSTKTLILRFITILDVDTALDLNGFGNTMALDWLGVNFENVPNVGTIKNFNNFVFETGAFLNSNGLILDEAFNTAAFSNSLFSGQNIATSIITLPATAVVSRRFRIIYSSFVVGALSTGINVNAAATISNERYILDNVNFSGAGTYTAGVAYTSNKALFTNCTGISNTAVAGQIYMQNNATVTTIALANTFYKVAGTTTASTDNTKVTTATTNRIVIDAAVRRKYRIDCTLSFTSSASNVCRFGFYDSSIAAVRNPSKTSATANAAGRAENVSFFCYADRIQNDYFEVWCENTTGANNITVTDLNFSITEV